MGRLSWIALEKIERPRLGVHAVSHPPPHALLEERTVYRKRALQQTMVVGKPQQDSNHAIEHSR